MKKLILFLSMLLMVGTLMVGCSSVENNDGDITEETEQEESQENTDEISKENNYEIPNDNWDLSQTFEHTVTNQNGKESTYTIVGNKETLGFTGSSPIVTDKIHKFFWFYWGEGNIYDKPVKVIALKKDSEEPIEVHSGTFYKGAQVSKDIVNMPSNVKFPSAGVWKLLIYIDREFYESIVVEVKENI